ncbi:uncharacterized protein LOC118438291 [Folsomia candida]|uniref:uncharacterized protein LOC118438291 n=1 Tax=Folsomia candida TaxID=158441 RepID=UPI0016053EE4|nr:uncharacterized protein LOC118438291 [Folsomia candida]
MIFEKMSSSNYHPISSYRPGVLVRLVNSQNPSNVYSLIRWKLPRNLILPPLKFRPNCKNVYIYTTSYQLPHHLTNIISVYTPVIHSRPKSAVNLRNEQLVLSHFYIFLISSYPQRHYKKGKDFDDEVMRNFVNFFAIIFLPEKDNKLNRKSYTVCLYSTQLIFPFFVHFRCLIDTGLDISWGKLKLARRWTNPTNIKNFKFDFRLLLLDTIFLYYNDTKEPFDSKLDAISRSTLLEPDTPLEFSSGVRNGWAVVFVDSKPLQFMSCYTPPELSFRFYYKPFQPAVWFAVMGCVLFLSGFSHCYLSKRYVTSFNSGLYFVATLLKDPAAIPVALRGEKVLSLVVIPWTFTAIVLTSAYLGLVITRLNSPPRGEPIATWEEAVCLEKLGAPSSIMNTSLPSVDQGFLHPRNISAGHCFSLLSPVNGPFDDQQFENNSIVLYKFVYSIVALWSKLAFLPSRIQTIFSAIVQNETTFFPLTPANRSFTRRELLSKVLEEVLLCGKTLLVATRQELDVVAERWHKTKFHIGAEPLKTTTTVWGFETYGEDIIVKGFKRIFESGIYTWLEKQSIAGDYLTVGRDLAEGDSFKHTIKIGGRIRTIFFIWMGASTLTILVFLVELMFLRCQRYAFFR